MSAHAPTAFISYSREDSEFVLRLTEDLKAAGASVWLDQLDIEPGHAWDSAIEKALREAPRMLLVLSPASAKSTNVRNEMSFALEENKIIIPVLHQDCAIPLQLHRIQRVDLRADYALGLNTLLMQLGVQPEGRIGAPAEARAQAPPAAPVDIPPPAVDRPTPAAIAPLPDRHSVATTVTSSRSPLPRGKSLWFLAVAMAALVAIGLAAFMTPAPVSGPLDSTQITSSADPKLGPLFTDGSRLYFDSRGEPSQMSVTGGPIVPMSILEPGMHILDISADASKVLGKKPDLNDNAARGTLWTASMLGGPPRKLSDHLALKARWSPDGRSVAFIEQRTLYAIDADGQNLRKIWDAPANLEDLSFSPDGQQLTVTAEVSGISRLWSMKADGRDAHLLLLDWPKKANQYFGQWTPDGKHFVFSSGREGRTNVYELVAPRWFEFWKKPTAVRITGNQIPILASIPARDSNGLYVLARMDEGAMRAYDPHSGKLAPYLDDFPMVQFVISPDRQWMAYTEYPSRHLWKSRLDGSEKVQLTNSFAMMEQWSPDGKSLVYSNFKNLYLVSADGGAPQKLTPDGHGDIAPTWSPDGKSIAFSYFPNPGVPLRIFLLDLASHQISTMPNAEGYFFPSWSPDGKYLAAIAENPSRLALYSARTGKWKDVHSFDVEWNYWTWSSDSKSLFLSSVDGKEDGIYRLTVPEGEWTKLCGLEGVSEANTYYSFLSLTPEGQPAIMSHTGIAQIYLLHWKP